ncbi:MAG TPA: hypothetical protein VF813_08940, partial [Anaerolineaceae bacterium]
VYAYRRFLEQDQVLVVTNPREARRDLAVPLPAGNTVRRWIDAFSGAVYASDQNSLRLPELAAKSGLVLTPFAQ